MSNDVADIEYHSPRGDVVTFGDAPYELNASPRNLASTGLATESVQAPGQVGVTLTAITRGTRQVSFPVDVVGSSHEDVWQLRQDLAAALWLPPTRPGREAQTGRLVIRRPGLDALEARAVPQQSPSGDDWLGPTVCQVDVEFSLPAGVWRATSDTTKRLESGGGFTFPLAHPWQSLSASLTAEVSNPGTVEAPVFVRVDGELTDMRLQLTHLDPTVEIVVDGLLGPDARYEIDTHPDELSVVLVESDGTRSNALSRVNFDQSDLAGWRLTPGVNEVRFTATDNVSGVCHLTWRPTYAGV